MQYDISIGESLNFFGIIVLRMFCRTIIICVVYSDLKKMELAHFHATIFYNFPLMNLKNLCLAIKRHPIALWKTGLMNLWTTVSNRRGPWRCCKNSRFGVRELIMQNHHVTYRLIEAFLEISSTSIHSILHGRKKYLFSLDPAQFGKRSKKVCVDWCKEMLEKYNGDASKDDYKIVTGNESWICAY